MTKFTTFAVTIRPRSGVTDCDIQLFADYVRKHCQFYRIVTEEEDDSRHIHSALYFKTDLSLSNLKLTLKRLFKHFDREEQININRSVKILYNNDWIDYIDKCNDRVVIENNLPELACLESWYPPKPDVKSYERRLYMHDTMQSYEKYWLEYMSSTAIVNTSVVRDFLFALQYKHRVIGLLDDKKLSQHAKWFCRWMHKAENCPDSFVPHWESEEGAGIHDTSGRAL